LQDCKQTENLEAREDKHNTILAQIKFVAILKSLLQNTLMSAILVSCDCRRLAEKLLKLAKSLDQTALLSLLGFELLRSIRI